MPASSNAAAAVPSENPSGYTRTNAESMATVLVLKGTSCTATTTPSAVSPGGVAAARRTRRRMTEDRIATRTRALAGALAESGFARLRVRDGETEIEVRRAPRPVAAPVAAGGAQG